MDALAFDNAGLKRSFHGERPVNIDRLDAGAEWAGKKTGHFREFSHRKQFVIALPRSFLLAVYAATAETVLVPRLYIAYPQLLRRVIHTHPPYRKFF